MKELRGRKEGEERATPSVEMYKLRLGAGFKSNNEQITNCQVWWVGVTFLGLRQS